MSDVWGDLSLDWLMDNYPEAVPIIDALVAERDALRGALNDMGLEASVCCTCDAVMQSVRPGKAQCLGCERAEAAEARVTELEADAQRVKLWFVSKPWEGDPDPRDFGGGPYTENERELGYGTYRDPRMLPPMLRAALVKEDTDE